ncbi:ABC transporter substrate-binding protein [Pseudonocardia sp. N23]|uniref:ABC transporter substrate-binding protein n=1 Tax=Pseudonocardia sp. N23 TaxID=1987376 RepID=UPI000C02B93D|nr:extracellular solute-binding protein [Pseudonocardia sp. N23]GAY07654.1 ABC transporter substrate-binding protein [Pseudonocardia sp. N23]
MKFFSRKCRSVALAVLTAGAMVFTAGCGSGGAPADAGGSVADPGEGGGPAWQTVVDAANKEGQVVLYSNSDGVNAAFEAAWAKAYPGIKLVVSKYASGELTTKLDAEKGGGVVGADVITVSTKPWLDANLNSLVAPTGPALGKYWGGSRYVYGDGRYVLVAATPLGAGVNTEQLAKLGNPPVTTYKDLLQPQFKGALGIVPGTGAPAAEQWWFYAAKEMGGDSAVGRLADLQPRLYTVPATLATDLASGEVAVGAYNVKGTIDALAAKGAPIKFVTLEPVISTPVTAAVVGWAKNPNAAQVFQNWLLSPGGQIALNGSGSLLTPLELPALGSVPSTMRSIPTGATVVDGVLTPEQKTWVTDLWKSKLRLG